LQSVSKDFGVRILCERGREKPFFFTPAEPVGQFFEYFTVEFRVLEMADVEAAAAPAAMRRVAMATAKTKRTRMALYSCGDSLLPYL